MDSDFAFWLRMLNLGLSVFVFVLCLTKLIWNDADRPRQARIIALGLLAISLAIGSYELRREPFSTRIPIATLAMSFAAYGMKSMSDRPEVYKHRRK